MNALYQIADTSKQAHLACMKRQRQREDQFLLLEVVLREERQKHPAMSLKKLYVRIAPDFVGRDLFIEYGMENGYEAISLHKSCRTTRPSKENTYPNLCAGLVLTDINQLWVSDITYFRQAASCKLQAASCKPQAASCKLQAASCKLQAASRKLQAASCKLQAASCKLQAASCKLQAASRKPASCKLQAASRKLQVTRGL
jgi:hypothetical protein